MNLGLLEKDLYCKQCHLRFVDKSVFKAHLSILQSDKIIMMSQKKKSLLVSLTESRKESNSCQTISVKEQHFVEQLFKTCSWNPKSDREGQCLFIRVRTHSSVLFVTIIVQENSTWLSTFH